MNTCAIHFLQSWAAEPATSPVLTFLGTLHLVGHASDLRPVYYSIAWAHSVNSRGVSSMNSLHVSCSGYNSSSSSLTEGHADLGSSLAAFDSFAASSSAGSFLSHSVKFLHFVEYQYDQPAAPKIRNVRFKVVELRRPNRATDAHDTSAVAGKWM